MVELTIRILTDPGRRAAGRRIRNDKKTVCTEGPKMADFEKDDDLEMDDDLGTVTLTLEDDSEVECMILAIYPAGGRDYIALLPMDENGEPEEDSDVLIYRYIDHGEDEDPEIENIEEDDEYETAADAFDEMLDEQEFEEEAGEGEDL